MVQPSPAQAFSDTFELADVFVVYKQETKKGGKFQMSEFNLFKDHRNKSYLSAEMTKYTIKLLLILYKKYHMALRPLRAHLIDWNPAHSVMVQFDLI